jgi:protocatechuate 3,4-dioxygenase alpha subunit
VNAPLAVTPGQTIGPFFAYALPYPGGADLVPVGRPDAIRLHGQVIDGAGEPIPDALVELWQLGPDGTVVQQPGSLHRDEWAFTGWGRGATDNAGHYSFTTLTPGRSATALPFFALTVFARGLLDKLFTRAYLPLDDDAAAADPLLARLPAARRATLIAAPDDGGYRFDIRLQGQDETVFLTYPGSPT